MVDDTNRPRAAGPSPRAQLTRLLLGFQASQAIIAAAQLGIADHLGEAPRAVEELAAATGAHAPSLRRLLLALASLGLFEEDEGGRFRHTRLSEPLRRDAAGSVRDLALLFGSAFMWSPFGALAGSVRTGQPSFNGLFGATFFEHLSSHADDAAIFNAAMTAVASSTRRGVIAACGPSRFGVIVDVGGGHGELLAGILEANPAARGVLFDRPEVVAGAPIGGPLAGRIERVGGDFFEAVPAGGDAYLLQQILHDWYDEDALRILRSCRAAMRPGASLLVIERVLAPANQPDPGRLTDLTMLCVVGGRERSGPELLALLEQAGFAFERVIPTGTPLSVVEAVARPSLSAPRPG